MLTPFLTRLCQANGKRVLCTALFAGLFLASSTASHAASADWNVNSSSTWSTPGNWTAGGPPDGIDQIAGFLNNISGTRTITLDISPTIGTLNVADSNNTHAFIIAGGNPLIFDVTAGNAAINKLPTDNTRLDTISAPITLMDNLVVTNEATASGGRIVLSGPIGDLGGARSIEKLGAGRLELTGANTFSGGVIVTAGALTVNGTSSNPTSGAVTDGPLGTGVLTLNGGTFIPSSSGSNTLANNITLNAVSTNAFAVGGNSTLTGNITGPGGFRKGSGGLLALTGANNYSGSTFAESGTLVFAQKQSLYNGNSANWTDINLIVGAGAIGGFAVGGPGEFTLSEFMTLATLGTATGGFMDGASIGIDTTNGGDQTISTVFTNNNAGVNKLGLAKLGTGTLFLTAANTHEGPTTAAGGTLNLSNQLAVQNSTLTLSGGTVDFDQSVAGNAFTLGGLAGNTALTLMNTAAAPIALTVGGNNTNTAYSGSIASVSGSSLTKVGTGALTLSGSNAHDGGTTVAGGTLNINNAGALGFGPLVINAGTSIDNTTTGNISIINGNPLTWNGNFTFTGTRALSFGTSAVSMTADTEINIPAVSGNNQALTIGGVISGNFTLTRAGTGRMFITGQNTFTGMNITGGAVVHVGDQSSNLLGGTGPLGIGVVSLSGGQLIGSSGTAFNTIENDFVLTGPAATNRFTTNGTMTLSGTISGTGGLAKSGNAPGTLILTAANTYSGETSVDSSTLTLANELAMQNSTLTTTGLIFDQTVVSNAFTLGGLSGSGDLVLDNNAAAPITLSVGNNHADTAHSGAISGTGSLTKIGTGTLALGGTNTYAGATAVNAGALLVNGSHTGGGAYTVASGATLGGNGSIGSSVAVSAGGILGPGASVGTLTVDSANIDGKLLVEFDGDLDTIDKLVVTGALDITGSTVDFDNVGVGSLSGSPHIFASYGSLLGTFTAVDLPTGFSINYNYLGTNQIALIGLAAQPGDFDGDGDVDGADFVAWQTNFPTAMGATLAQGDADGDGDVDGADFVVWQTNFPFTPGPGASPVPEPGTVCLAICGLIGLGALRRRCTARSN